MQEVLARQLAHSVASGPVFPSIHHLPLYSTAAMPQLPTSNSNFMPGIKLERPELTPEDNQSGSGYVQHLQSEYFR